MPPRKKRARAFQRTLDAQASLPFQGKAERSCFEEAVQAALKASGESKKKKNSGTKKRQMTKAHICCLELFDRMEKENGSKESPSCLEWSELKSHCQKPDAKAGLRIIYDSYQMISKASWNPSQQSRRKRKDTHDGEDLPDAGADAKNDNDGASVGSKQTRARPEGASSNNLQATACSDAEAMKLWSWYREIDMQQFSHIGDETTASCWNSLAKMKEMTRAEFLRDPELVNLAAAVRIQYLSAFTGRAKRRRRRSGYRGKHK